MWPHRAQLKIFFGCGWSFAISIGGDIVQQSAASKAGKFIPHIGDFSGSPKVRNHEIALFAKECDLGGSDHNAHSEVIPFSSLRGNWSMPPEA
jgi:hypothetical protein